MHTEKVLVASHSSFTTWTKIFDKLHYPDVYRTLMVLFHSSTKSLQYHSEQQSTTLPPMSIGLDLNSKIYSPLTTIILPNVGTVFSGSSQYGCCNKPHWIYIIVHTMWMSRNGLKAHYLHLCFQVRSIISCCVFLICLSCDFVAIQVQIFKPWLPCNFGRFAKTERMHSRGGDEETVCILVARTDTTDFFS